MTSLVRVSIVCLFSLSCDVASIDSFVTCQLGTRARTWAAGPGRPETQMFPRKKKWKRGKLQNKQLQYLRNHEGDCTMLFGIFVDHMLESIVDGFWTYCWSTSMNQRL